MSTLKTIKQLADELHVSKTAVRKYMTADFRENHTKTDHNGVIVITEEGCKLIAQIIENNRKPFAEAPENKVSVDSITIPKEVWDVIQEQLKSKDEQIQSLQQALDQEQRLHASSVTRLHALEAPKRGLLGWFRKKDGE